LCEPDSEEKLVHTLKETINTNEYQPFLSTKETPAEARVLSTKNVSPCFRGIFAFRPKLRPKKNNNNTTIQIRQRVLSKEV
jgi:hypothetical protein